MTSSRILLLTKRDRFSDEAIRIARASFAEVEVARGDFGDPRPQLAAPRLLSFLSPWIVPASVLDAAEWAINFHPGPREYPGIGCYNFALYEGAAEYGAVCHHMAPAVDTGAIIAETRFPIAPDETVQSLRNRTLDAMLALFEQIVPRLAARRELPTAATWSRRPFRRGELEALRHVTQEMPAEEIRRRERAITYPGYPGLVFD